MAVVSWKGLLVSDDGVIVLRWMMDVETTPLY